MSVSKEAIEAASATYWQNHWKIFSENAKRPIRETMEKALEAALPFLPVAGERKVKALEFASYRDSEGSAPRWKAEHTFGEYRIILNTRDMEYWSPQFGGLTGNAWTSLEAAKAAAQSDYETRILSALISSPGKDGGLLNERRNSQFAEGDSRLPTPISAPVTLGSEGRENRAILPCPFCHGTNLTNHGKEIECQDCGALGPLPPEGEVSEAMAISLWNQRTVSNHPDDLAVDRFAAAMKAKLAKKRAEGRGGWDGPTCSADILSSLLREHVEKGDPLDVGNLAMMLHQRAERIM